MLKYSFLFVFLFLATSHVFTQNVIIGSNGFITRGLSTDGGGLGVYTRMGIEVYNNELGIKSHYANLNSQESYGVSLYSFIPFYEYKKWQALAHVEGGFSFVYADWFGSERAIFMGVGPSLRYNLREYFQFELTLEYVIFANITKEAPLYTQVLIPTIGWSVRI